MSGVSSISGTLAALQAMAGQSSQTATSRPSDGDTPAQEAAESMSTKMAEAQNGGYAPSSTHIVDKKA